MLFQINGVLLLLLFPIFYPLYRMSLLRKEKIRCAMYNLRHDLFIYAYENNLLEDENYKKFRNKINTTIRNVHRFSLSWLIVFHITSNVFFNKKEKEMLRAIGKTNITIDDSNFKNYDMKYQEIIVKSVVSLPVKIIFLLIAIPIGCYKYTTSIFSRNKNTTQENQTQTLNRWATSLTPSLCG